ncbi:helix-turn-helix transcriptional regulator [Mycobacterium syngnathidarum]
MAGKKIDLGASGQTVAANVKRLRGAVTYTELSERLRKLGRGISPIAVRRIEENDRRVDVDDLTAIAVALGVSPVTLLMPSNVSADEIVTLADAEFKAAALWEWLIAEWPFPQQSGLAEFYARALPPWKLAEVERRITERHRVQGALQKARESWYDDESIEGLQRANESQITTRMTPAINENWSKAMDLIGKDDAAAERLLTEIFKDLGIVDGNDQ